MLFNDIIINEGDLESIPNQISISDAAIVPDDFVDSTQHELMANFNKLINSKVSTEYTEYYKIIKILEKYLIIIILNIVKKRLNIIKNLEHK